VPAIPAKPVPAKPAPVLPAPAKPVPAKPAPAPSAPAKPANTQSAPIATTHEPFSDAGAKTIDIEVFVREDCPNCVKAREFLAKLKNLKPKLQITIRDVRKEPAALELLKRMAQYQGEAALDYPAFVVGGQLIIGFSEEASTAQLILDTLATSHPTSLESDNGTKDCETGKELSCGLITPAPAAKPEIATINILGHSVPLVQIGIPLLTLAMGLLDGLNHGSTWVLILMISLLSPMKNRPLLFAIAGTFIAVQGIVYFILLAVWLNLFAMAGTSRISEIAIASIALLAAAIYFKKYMNFGQSLSISSHEIAKPGIYTRIRKIVQAENLTVALLGTTVLAILVQIGEFSYTSVFPALYTRVLTLQHLDSLSNYGYLLLYDFAYMLDDVIVLIIGVVTLSQGRSQEQEGPMLKLVSGLVMIGLGAYLLLVQH
jgi:glutaredoxin